MINSESNFDILLRELAEIRKSVSELEKTLIRSQSDFLDIEQASLLTGFSKSHIYKLSSKNTIPCFKMGRKLMFVKEELLSWIKRNYQI